MNSNYAGDTSGRLLSQDDLISGLREVVGAKSLTIDPDAMSAYTTDWTGGWSGPAIAVVHPSDVDQVSKVLSLCGDANVDVLPQGGNTGLVGGGVPAADAKQTVILSTTRLKGLAPIDESSGLVEVGAGELVSEVQVHASNAGWYYGVDLASRDSATIGGTVATNAGGIRACAFGMTRSQVAGIEAVLADGTVTRTMRGLTRDNTGYDLANIFCGSEGTLGVITSVLLQLHAPFGPTRIVMVGLDDLSSALELATSARASSLLVAAEVVDADGMNGVCELADLPWPLRSRDWSYIALIECKSGADDDADLEWIPNDADAVVATTLADKSRFWQYRERQSENAQRLPDRALGHKLIKLDVSVPIGELSSFDRELRELIAPRPIIIFGHFLDGNLHVEISAGSDELDAVTASVLELVASFGGSISAEHGVGRAKAQYLKLSRHEGEIRAMKAVKAALDPKGIMAPGVIFGN